eukprot:CAMPEP_0185845522 /NCGR_PEP_ID=MMETSP1354-20130828/1473_1 /TAXON_ID=708628 /ORGANISM="Erythrolobus madagascarensis, Strain CCMP3276" /LENGTH=814 /DNA_ID=CAMNT_0028545509 /DNA_START=78 /DNA_END=2522 /DNA_ORIENTATION=+
MDGHEDDVGVVHVAAEKDGGAEKGGRPMWGWDYCFVFNGDAKYKEDDEKDMAAKAKRDGHRTRLLATLRQAGFVTSQITSRDAEKILLRFSLPEDVMKAKAEHLEFRIKLKDDYGGGYLGYAADRDSCYVNDELVLKGEPYFTSAQRINITRQVLALDDSEGCGLNLAVEKYKKHILASFAFHYKPEQRALVYSAVWHQWWNPFWDPPFDSLEKYLGSELGLYFAFVAFLGKFLWIVTFFGIPVYIVFLLKVDDKVTSALNLVYSVIMGLWSALFIELWKRRNADINLKWGTVHLDFDEADNVRPEFTGELQAGFHFDRGFVKLDDLVQKKLAEEAIAKSELPESAAMDGADDGLANDDASSSDSSAGGDQDEHAAHELTEAMLEAKRVEKKKMADCRRLDIPVNKHYPPNKRLRTIIISAFLTVFFAACAVAVQVVLLYFRDDIVEGLPPSAAIVPGLINGVMIVVLDISWGAISLYITNRENHRSDQDYQNSLIAKRFAFQFFSNYTSLFYLAFFKPFIVRVENRCSIGWLQENPTCMSDMSFQLLTLLATRVTVSQALEVLIPFLITKLKKILTWFKVRKRVKNSENASTDTSRYYRESNKAPYASVLNDYNEIVILFGYVAMFAVAFPLAPLLVLFNNVVEVRTDAFKILKLFQRVNANPGDDIGAWEAALQVLSYVSVLTNSGMLVYTSNSLSFLFGDLDPWEKLLAFFIMQNALFGMKILVSLVPDVSLPAAKKLERQTFDIALAFGVDMKNHYKARQFFALGTSTREAAANQLLDFDTASDLEDVMKRTEGPPSATASQSAPAASKK